MISTNRPSPIRVVSVALATAATAVLLLTGCSTNASPDGGTEPSSRTSQPSQTPEATTDPSSTAPSSTDPSSTAPSSTDPSESEKPGGADGKPSKSEVVAGLTKFYQEEQNLSKDKATTFATCMVDQMYDEASATTLKAMRDGQPTKMDEDDQGLLLKAAEKCGPALQ